MKRFLSLLLVTCLMVIAFPVTAEAPISLDALMMDISKEAKALTVSQATFRISNDRQHIYIDRPEITGSDDYTIAYNIYDSDSNPVNYFYSAEEHVAATPGYGGLFNVFIVVTDTATGEQNTQNIGWQELSWPLADTLTVGKATYEVSPDKKSIFVDRPSIKCKSGSVTIAYNIYDSASQPVNYFYSTLKRVAATPGYDGKFNVFIVVTDTETGEQDVQNIGWTILGDSPQPTIEPTVEPTAEPTTQPTSDPVGFEYTVTDGQVTITRYTGSDAELVIPSSIEGMPVTNIGDSAFKRCESLTNVVIPDSIITIGSYSFQYCTALSSIVIPDSVKSIDIYAFGDCKKLSNITFGKGITSIGSYAFSACQSLKEVVIPDNVVTIRDGAFSYNNNLTSVVLPSRITYIDTRLFCSCSNLVDVNIPPNVTSIGEEAFGSCQSLTDISIPDGVTYIDREAFHYCTGLSSIDIPDSVVTIGNSAFAGCKGLTSVIIPNSVTSLGKSAFGVCENLKEVTISDHITVLSDGVFEYCYSLESIIIPESVTGIGMEVFAACKNLRSIRIPNNVMSIGQAAFLSCTGLYSIIIPQSVTSIGFAAFSDCSALNSVYFTGTKEQWDNIAIATANSELINAEIVFNYVLPSTGK